MPTVRRRPRFDSLAQEAYLSLWRTYDRLRMLEDELFAEHDLTAQQYNALRLLAARHPGTLPTLGIAQRLVSRAPDITRLLDKLAERELIERVRPEDNRRVVNVGIAAAGLDLLCRLETAVRDCHERQLGHMKRGELKALVALLRFAREPHESPESVWR